MDKNKMGDSFSKAWQKAAGAVNAAKAAVQDMTKRTKPKSKEKVSSAEEAKRHAVPEIRCIATRNALQIIYYLMVTDGAVFHSEEVKFDAIGAELDPAFTENKPTIVKACQTQLEKVIDPEDYYDVLQDGVEEAILSSCETGDTFISPKLLVWNLLTIAYSDESYNETEQKLLTYIVGKLQIDKAVFLEMESSILTILDIERELAWIKTTDRPYLIIEARINELTKRKSVIFDSVKDLITL